MDLEFKKKQSVLTKYHIDPDTKKPITVPVIEKQQVHPLKNLIQMVGEVKKNKKIQIIDRDMIPVNKPEKITQPYHYYVDYEQNLIHFHPDVAGQTVEYKYEDMGVTVISANKIFTKQDEKGNVVELLEDIIRLGREAIDVMETIGGVAIVMKRLEDDIKEGYEVSDKIQADIKQAKDEILNVRGNKEVIIKTSDWTLNVDVYEKEITHDLNSENLHVTAKNSDTKEAVTIGYKIVDKTRILLKSDEAINMSVILSASYYHATQTISDNISEEVVKSRKGEVSLDVKITKIDEQLDTIKHKISLNIKDFGAKGDGVTDDTEAFIKAGKSGQYVDIISGDYIISDVVTLSPNTHFYGERGVNIRLNKDIDLFKLTWNNTIYGVDIYTTKNYTSNVIEISSKTLENVSSAIFRYNLLMRLEKIRLFANNSNDTPKGTFIYIWSSKELEDGTRYNRSGFWGIKVNDIYTTGDIGYFCRNYSYRKNNDTYDGWITGVNFENISIDSACYGFFGSKSEETMNDLRYVDIGNLYINNCQYQCNNSRRFGFFTQGAKIITDSIAWDWQNSYNQYNPYLIRYGSDYWYKIYINNEYGDIASRVDVLNYSTDFYVKKEYLKKCFSEYIDINESMYDKQRNNTTYRTSNLTQNSSDEAPLFYKTKPFKTSNSVITMNGEIDASYGLYYYGIGCLKFTLTITNASSSNDESPNLIVSTDNPVLFKFFDFYVRKNINNDSENTLEVVIYQRYAIGSGVCLFSWSYSSSTTLFNEMLEVTRCEPIPLENLSKGVTHYNRLFLNSVSEADSSYKSPGLENEVIFNSNKKRPEWLNNNKKWEPFPMVNKGSFTIPSEGRITIPFNKLFYEGQEPTVILTPTNDVEGKYYIYSSNWYDFIVYGPPGLKLNWLAIS